MSEGGRMSEVREVGKPWFQAFSLNYVTWALPLVTCTSFTSVLMERGESSSFSSSLENLWPFYPCSQIQASV